MHVRVDFRLPDFVLRRVGDLSRPQRGRRAYAAADYPKRGRGQGGIGMIMTIEERAACIADQAIGTARGALRRKRVYDKAVQMLMEISECPTCGAREVSEAELLNRLSR